MVADRRERDPVPAAVAEVLEMELLAVRVSRKADEIEALVILRFEVLSDDMLVGACRCSGWPSRRVT